MIKLIFLLDSKNSISFSLVIEILATIYQVTYLSISNNNKETSNLKQNKFRYVTNNSQHFTFHVININRKNSEQQNYLD